MNVNFFNEDHSSMSHSFASSHRKPHKRYGCLGFLLDIIMVLLTGGLWLIWIFVREMRRRSV